MILLVLVLNGNHIRGVMVSILASSVDTEPFGSNFPFEKEGKYLQLHSNLHFLIVELFM
jgi:hypothetical protein